MIFFYILIVFFTIGCGAVFGRLDGGGIAKVSEWVERSLIMFFFVLACAPFAGFYSLFAYAGVAGIATGHGQYFLSLSVKAVSGERFDFFVRWLFGRDPRTAQEFIQWRDDNWKNAPQEVKDKIHLKMQDYGLNRLYWRNVFGMFVTGTIVGIPAFIVSISFGQLYGALFLLTGVVKSFSYVVGWKFFQSTEPAEYFNGGLRNVICLTVIALALLSN